MTLSEISIRRPVFAWMLRVGLITFGCQLPDVDFPVITISLTDEGVALEVMEFDIVDIIEDSVMTVQRICSVSSVSRHGAAKVTIEFNLNQNIDTALQEVQTKIAQAQGRLPKEMEPPVISKTNPLGLKI